MLRVATLAALAQAGAADVVLATFDGDLTKSTELAWETVNDPVMGGQSWSNEHEDASASHHNQDTDRGVAVWTGYVKKVIFLNAPGFCTLRSPPRAQEGQVEFPDLTGTDGLSVTLRQAQAGGLTHFGVRLRTNSMTEMETSYNADFEVGGNMQEHFVPWTKFVCTWRGEESDKCPEGGLAAELDDVSSVGLGTYYPGRVGPFTIEMESMVARGATAAEADHSQGLKAELAHALKTTRTLGMEVFV